MAYKTLALGTLSAATLAIVYTVPSNSTTAVYSCVLTNTTNNNITVDLLINDTSADYLVKKVVIPAGSGRCVKITEAQMAISSIHTLKLLPYSADAFNYLITGDEV